MTEQKDEVFWNLSNILEGDPWAKSAEIVTQDRANAAKAEEALGSWIELLDRCVGMFVATFAAAYSPGVRERWVEDDQKRAAMAMLVSCANYLLLIRQTLAMGYYPESQGLIRDLFERNSRALLFIIDAGWAEMFWQDKRINQPDVDDALAGHFAKEGDDEDRKQLYESFREPYTRRSGMAHANLRSLGWRTAGMKPDEYVKDRTKELRKSVGTDVFLGGLIGIETGKVFMADAVKQGLEAISTLVMIVTDDSGDLMKHYRTLRADIESAVASLDSMLPPVDGGQG